MQRITITVDDDLLDQFDRYLADKGYGNRSEGFRDLIRDRLARQSLDAADGGTCVACVSYVYNHHERQLSRRLVEAQHAHHDIGVTTLHVHLDHDNCMEALVLEGPTPAVRDFAETLAAEEGVRHANVHLVPVRSDRASHSHTGRGGTATEHSHHHPRT
ncbi:MAG: nickel-responsive transcriptional regulator NikR [Alphaproteobacteria bacterium]|jgi:CopG family nickel-responsive transcriptional regulator|nr:nickel-responsive transcriptional regulator NikR [Alphaproteobacteria bacterium]